MAPIVLTNRMSKITFRADDELIQQLETFDASKSEVMREALREYLEAHEGESVTADRGSVDRLIAERVDDIIADRLDNSLPRNEPRDVNVNITLDGDSIPNHAIEGVSATVPTGDVSNDEMNRKTTAEDGENTADADRKTCSQCGENVTPGHVYCPNCGEKATHRVFCECGDELRSDWAFCPSCGRRTPAAGVLDQA